MAMFTQGQTVRARVTAQGMTAGAQYTVQEVTTFPTAFGDFVTYTLEDAQGTQFDVGNGHLLLDEVK